MYREQKALMGAHVAEERAIKNLLRHLAPRWPILPNFRAVPPGARQGLANDCPSSQFSILGHSTIPLSCAVPQGRIYTNIEVRTRELLSRSTRSVSEPQMMTGIKPFQ